MHCFQPGAPMNILYVGEMGDAVNNLIALSKISSEVIMLNTSRTDFFDEVPGMKRAVGASCRVHNLFDGHPLSGGSVATLLRKGERYSVGIFGPGVARRMASPKNIAEKIRKIITEENIDIVIAGWGVSVIPDITLLRVFDDCKPVIHYLPTFPTSQMSWLREWIELLVFQRGRKLFQGFVVGSDAMKTFLSEKMGVNPAAIYVGPLYYTSEYFAKRRLPLLSDVDGEPHLAFTGTTDFSKPYNDVREQLFAICDKGIHVHCAEPKERMEGNPYLHFFPRFDTPELVDGSLANFMTQFDACLVLYNGRKGRLRYRFSVPQRFLFCFTAGIPIFLPSKTFDACEEIIRTNDSGFVYSDLSDAVSLLGDRESMGEMREKTLAASSHFSFEVQSKDFQRFLSSYLTLD